MTIPDLPVDPYASTAMPDPKELEAIRARIAEVSKAFDGDAAAGDSTKVSPGQKRVVKKGGTVVMASAPSPTPAPAIDPARRPKAGTTVMPQATPAQAATPMYVSPPKAAAGDEVTIVTAPASQPGAIPSMHVASIPSVNIPSAPVTLGRSAPRAVSAAMPAIEGGPLQLGGRVEIDLGTGQKYYGTLQQIGPGRCLVLFNDGQSRWIDTPHVRSFR